MLHSASMNFKGVDNFLTAKVMEQKWELLLDALYIRT